MAERATIARPYAKAVFEAARDTKTFADWSKGLEAAAAVTADARVAELIKNPEVPSGDVADFIIGIVAAGLKPEMQNFVRILAENHRLLLLPEILVHYEALRADAENSVDVEVISAVQLSAAQAEKLTQALNGRLKRQVRMHNSVDAGLLGGAVIRAGDLVIDGSLKGRLERLRTELTG